MVRLLEQTRRSIVALKRGEVERMLSCTKSNVFVLARVQEIKEVGRDAAKEQKLSIRKLCLTYKNFINNR